MEGALSYTTSSFVDVCNHFSHRVRGPLFTTPFPVTNFRNFRNNKRISSSLSLPTLCVASTATPTPTSSRVSAGNRHWMVLVEKPPRELPTKADIVNYYVETLEKVLGNERDAQMSIYDTSCDSLFGFCCEVDEEASRQLACLPGVLSVRPDPDCFSARKDYCFATGSGFAVPLFAPETVKHWMVHIDKPGVGIVTKAQMVDYCVQLLSKVLGSEKDAQMCLYHISWQSNFGFCCVLDDGCADELAGVPGVLAVVTDNNFESPNKDYRGNNSHNLGVQDNSEAAPIKTKKLFVTGLSFYTSEKTLRAAFEGFGELVEVKIIMDKISKRSKGYAFVEYTTEEAASAALKEMNGKIINGWMIVVDVAKTKPSKHNRNQPRPQF